MVTLLFSFTLWNLWSFSENYCLFQIFYLKFYSYIPSYSFNLSNSFALQIRKFFYLFYQPSLKFKISLCFDASMMDTNILFLVIYYQTLRTTYNYSKKCALINLLFLMHAIEADHLHEGRIISRGWSFRLQRALKDTVCQSDR